MAHLAGLAFGYYMNPTTGSVATGVDWAVDSRSWEGDRVAQLKSLVEVIISGFRPETKERILTELAEVVKGFENHDHDAWLDEAFAQVGDRIEGIHEPEFEVAGCHTKSGNPHLISFKLSDFVFEECE